MGKKIYYISLPIVILALSLDQLIKFWVKSVDVNMTVINDFFYLDYTKNFGISFSMFNDKVLGIILVSLVAVGFILYVLFQYQDKIIYNVLISFILAGAMGNLIDRIILGYVVDYIALVFGDYHFAIFNLADMMLVCGTILLLIVVYAEDFKGENGKNSN